jgi:hypothetical protein
MSTYPSNRKARFERWFDCAVCGVPWPESMLTTLYGRLVCPDDYDAPCFADNVRASGEELGEEPRDVPWTPDGDDR